MSIQGTIIRTKTLGEDYTAESLISRIRWRDVGACVTLNGEPAPLRSDYINIIDEVTQLAAMGKKAQRKRDSNASYSPANDMDIYKLSAQLTIINRDNIHSIGELEGKIENLKAEYETARKELNQLTAKQDSMDSLIEQTERYFELEDKPQLTLSEKLKLNICKQAIRYLFISKFCDFINHYIIYFNTKDPIHFIIHQCFSVCRIGA